MRQYGKKPTSGTVKKREEDIPRPAANGQYGKLAAKKSPSVLPVNLSKEVKTVAKVKPIPVATPKEIKAVVEKVKELEETPRKFTKPAKTKKKGFFGKDK